MVMTGVLTLQQPLVVATDYDFDQPAFWTVEKAG
jgi:hypothetical protein